MPKYSTGGSGGSGSGDACELCGRETGDLRESNVAGARLLVCSNCAPHGDGGSGRGSRSRSGGSRDAERDRRKRAAQRTARMYDAGKGDSRRWEEGTDYEEDRLPYLVSGYGERVEAARQEVGLTVEELAAELDADEDDVLAVEQGRAARAGVGGSVVRALEARLDVTLAEDGDGA